MRCARCHRTLTDPESLESGYGRKCYIKVFGKRPKEASRNRPKAVVKSASPEDEQLPGQLSVYDFEQKESAGPDDQREMLQNG